MGALFLAGGLPRDRASPSLFSAAVGGPFELRHVSGRRFGTRDLAGKPFAIFFGFTQCPDVCPTTLLDISNHIAALGGAAARINVVFVSVDPERDTAEHMQAYLASFDPRIVGLTGTPEEIAAIVRAYRVLVQKVPTTSGYTINHTATVFLMDAKGRFFGTMSFQEPAETQLAKLRRLAGS
jgi:protein SCO1/2